MFLRPPPGSETFRRTAPDIRILLAVCLQSGTGALNASPTERKFM
jgi:hypothetical protein